MISVLLTNPAYLPEEWEICGDDIFTLHQLELYEQAVLMDEARIQQFYQDKLTRAFRRKINVQKKEKEKVKTLGYQRKADSYKRNCKKKGYTLKVKGQTRKAHEIVPPDSLGWDKVNMSIMGYKLHGIKVGYIFDVT